MLMTILLQGLQLPLVQKVRLSQYRCDLTPKKTYFVLFTLPVQRLTRQMWILPIMRNCILLHQIDQTGPDPLSIHIYLDAKRENASVDDIQELIENAIRRMQVSETPPEDEDQIPLILEEKDDEGRLPVHIACLNRAKVDVVRLLVSQSPASLRTKDTYGWYPLHIAICYDASASVIQYLLDKDPEALWRERYVWT